MATRRVRYSPLATDDNDVAINRSFDPRFDYTPKALDKVPWKSIALALFLLFLGTGLLFLSYFIFTGHMGGERSQAYGLLALGFLSFLPGMLDSLNEWYALCMLSILFNEYKNNKINGFHDSLRLLS